MKNTAIVDRFEGDYIILEVENEDTIQIHKHNAPFMIGEGMVVQYHGDYIISVDHEATDAREAELRRRFERLLKKSD